MDLQNEIDEQFDVLRKNYPGRELQINRLQYLIGDVNILFKLNFQYKFKFEIKNSNLLL